MYFVWLTKSWSVTTSKYVRGCISLQHQKSRSYTARRLYTSSSKQEDGQDNRKMQEEHAKRILKKRMKEEKTQAKLENLRLKAQHKKHISEEEVIYLTDTPPGEKKETACPLPATYNRKYTEAAWYEWWEKQGFFNPDFNQKLSKAVNEAFIRLHEEGLIYRSKRMVNWSCALKSAISDIEVEDVEISEKTSLVVPGYQRKVSFGVLTYFAYPVEDSAEEIVVATTRPETMLGDTGVAVHPSDDRYMHLHGKQVIHPLSGRRIPIVCDEFVDREYGSGAVKITPCHDTKDYEVGKRHNLEFIDILDDSGHLINVPDEFMGMKRFEARKRVVDELKSKGLYREEKANPMAVPICSRSKDVIEPRLKDQWYVDCQEMAADAVKVVKSGELKLIPNSYEQQWFQWLENTQDWCISRQLWWGHRVPAYTINFMNYSADKETNRWVSAHSLEEAKQKACKKFSVSEGDIEVSQDEDVLDTWFSSALFPFSIFGWPKQTADYDRFYSTHLLETASDIMFFWVARMIMMGRKLTGKLPFNEVLFHSILRDAHGRKMSKSLGNIVDPMDVINGISLEDLQSKLQDSNLDTKEIEKAKKGQEKSFPLGIPECGTDALRFTLCSYNYKAQFVNVNVDHIKVNRNFCNKIWQAYKYTMANLGDGFVPKPLSELKQLNIGNHTDWWMLSRLSYIVELCDSNFKSYDLNIAAQGLLTFWWKEYCDIYLEYSKRILAGENQSHVETTRQVLLTCVNTGLRLLSPFMPFLTEELFQRLPGGLSDRVESICLAEYPRPEEYIWRNEKIEEEMDTIKSLVLPVLSLRSDFNLTKAKPQVYIRSDSPKVKSSLQNHSVTFDVLSRSSGVTIIDSSGLDPEGCCCAESSNGDPVFLHVQGHIDVNTERTRLQKNIQKYEEQRQKIINKIEKSSNMEEHLLLIEQEKARTIETELKRKNNALSMLEKWES